MAAVSPIPNPTYLPPRPPTVCHKLRGTRTRPPHPSPHPLSLTVSGQGALDDPHGFQGESILGQPPQRHRRRTSERLSSLARPAS